MPYTDNNHTSATINGTAYRVYMPSNSWDMNFHFINHDGADYLVDLQDVIDWKYTDEEEQPGKTYGASLADAVAYAAELADAGEQWYWKEAGK